MSGNANYQWTLRAVGAFLDGEGGSFISLVETEDGFALRYRAPDADSVLRRFSTPELQSLNHSMQSRRADDAVDHIVSRDEAESYSDWLRALGWELDQSDAYSVVCDEVNGNMLVTYLHLDPRLGHAVEKRLAVLSPVDRIAILRDARLRRGQG